MDNKTRKTLYDILNCIIEIESFFEDSPKRFDLYCQNQMLKKAVQMNISIIGEATNRILKAEPDIMISNARKIVNTRNYVIHGYDSVSDDMIWSIVINHLPKLKKEVQALLSDNENMSIMS